MAQEEDYGASNSGEMPCITHGGRVMNQVIRGRLRRKSRAIQDLCAIKPEPMGED